MMRLHDVARRYHVIERGAAAVLAGTGVALVGRRWLRRPVAVLEQTVERRTLELERSQAELRQANAQLEQRVRELTALLTVSSEVASTLELDDLIGVILDQLRAVVDYSAAAIFLLEGSDTLRLIKYHGPLPADELTYTWSLADAVHSREVVATAAPVVIADVNADTPLARAFRSVAVAQLGDVPAYIGSWMGVPLVLRGAVIGVLAFDHQSPGFYSAEHGRVALIFANQAAIAIENARLFVQAQGVAALVERQRLARELHDSVSQALYAIALGARAARTLLDRDPTRVAEPLDYVLSMAEAGMAEMRALIFELRPESLETEGLVAALSKQAASLHARHRIAVATELGAEPDVSLETKEALYRIAQEAMHNTVKHARADRVELRLHCDDERIVLDVIDDGLGFDATGAFPGHLGLVSMRERVTRLGGMLDLRSAPGQGTEIRAEVPLRAAR